MANGLAEVYVASIDEEKAIASTHSRAEWLAMAKEAEKKGFTKLSEEYAHYATLT